MTTRSFQILTALAALCLFTGCVSNTATRYNDNGTPWDTSRTTFFLAKASADNFEQSIKEAKGGQYEKTTKIKKPGVESQAGELMGAMAQLVSLVEKLLAKQVTGAP